MDRGEVKLHCSSLRIHLIFVSEGHLGEDRTRYADHKIWHLENLLARSRILVRFGVYFLRNSMEVSKDDTTL